MPHRSMPIPLLALATVLLGSVPTVHAGQGTPPVPSTPVVASEEGGAGSAPLLRLVLTEPPRDEVAVVGVTRTTYAPGAGLRGSAGGGPLVLFVETGALLVRSIEAPSPILVVDPEAAPASGTPEPVPTGDERRLEAGTALVVPAGGVAEIRNEGGDPAATLDLLAATNAQLELETGVSQAVLASREANLPTPPVVVTLAQATIAPGDRYALPPPPAEAVIVTVDRAQAFLLTGGNFNRGSNPMPVYVLTFTTAGPSEGTPTA